MRYLSPLRYPGGKARLAPFLARVIQAQTPRPTIYAEPFAGGVGAGLRLLHDGVVDHLLINDLNPGIAAFWRSCTATPDALIDKIHATNVTLDTWHEQRHIYTSPYQHDDVTLGFATFFLNRTNRSGILSAKPIGGLNQDSAWKLDARFNKNNLIARIRNVARLSNRITVSEVDALAFLAELEQRPGEHLIYVDPPYLEAGGRLYMSQFTGENHTELRDQLDNTSHYWILTYDDDARVYEDLYHHYTVAKFDISHTANVNHLGSETIVFSHRLHLPDLQVTRLSRGRMRA